MADALSRKAQHSLNIVVITQLNILRELEQLGIQLVSHRQARVYLSTLTLKPSIMEEIQVKSERDPKLQRMKQNLEKGKSPSFAI